MKSEYVIGLFVLAAMVLILLSVYTGDLLYFTKFPAVGLFGFAMIMVFSHAYAFLHIARGKSPRMVCNIGHFSIVATKDIKDIPWMVETDDDELKNIKHLEIRMMFTGGIDAYGISPRSTPEHPVFIAPKIYCHKEEKNYPWYANFELYEIDELPMYIQYILKRSYSTRVKEKTPIYYSEVSHLDGSATPENVKKMQDRKEQNKENSVYIDRIIRLYDELERGQKAKRPKIFMKNQLEEVKEDS